MITDIDRSNMNIAIEMSKRSKAIRAKVGCLLVTVDNIMIGSYNGTPSGWDNDCEYTSFNFVDNNPDNPLDGQHIVAGDLVTKSEVIHAELNAILHAARQGVSVKGSTMYVTLSTCMGCAAMLSQVGIKRVVYLSEYRCKKGIDMLKKHGIIVEQID